MPVRHPSRDVEWTVESGLWEEVEFGSHRQIEYVKSLNWMRSSKESVYMKRTRWTFRDWEKWKDPAKETKKENQRSIIP